jgi:nucleoside-diphosphate-sugar epimerase
LNYRATVRLARLASAAGIGCFVFLSSVKAMGFPASPEVRAENACSRPTEAYGLSKWKAEEALREAFSDDPMSIVIVRPALVYGAGVKGNLQHLATAVRWGLPRPPEGGDRSMVAIEDLVELLCIVAQHPPPGIHTWIVCGADNYSTREVYDLLREAAGKGRGGDWLPRWVWWVGACLLDFARGRDGGSTYDKLFGAELYTNAAVLADTRWQPRVRLEDIAARIARVGSSGS